MLQIPIKLTAQDEADIIRARQIEKEISQLQEVQDRLLNPICEKVTEFSKIEDVRVLISKLPSGFHRSELRVLLNFLNDGC